MYFTMITVNVSEIQRKISLFRKKEPIRIFDKKEKIEVGIFYPHQNQEEKSIVDSLAGKYAKYVTEETKKLSWDQIREKAWNEYISEKYGDVS